MENHQIFALVLGFLGLYGWIAKGRKINILGRLVDEDKIERRKLLEKYYSIYILVVILMSATIWNSEIISNFFYDYFNRYYISSMQISIFLYISFMILALYFRGKFNPKSKNNKNIIAKPNSTFKLSPKKLKIGVIEGNFLKQKLMTFLSFTIRVDDFTIQKVKFDKEGILLKREYIKKNFEANRFNEEDFNIIKKVEEEITSRNDYEFKEYEKMETRIKQLIKAIQSQKKFTFGFGQIKQYSNSLLIDEILLFLQEIQEDRYSDSSLPYLLHFQKIVK